MKKTPLYEAHKSLNARMVDFGGWEMPVWYSNIIDEHKATRTKVGIFDTSHMGEIVIKGQNSLELVQRLTTNDVSKLKENEAQYSMMCHKNGCVVDDLYVYRIDKEEYLLVVNASNIKKDLKHINRVTKRYSNTEVKDISEETTMLALQGPGAEDLLKKIYTHIPKRKNTFTQLEQLEFGASKVIVSRTGYTGEDGFELFINSQEYTKNIWERMIIGGATPCGLGARDTLRLEMGYPLYGNELNDQITPLEADLEWVVCFEKDFLGKEALLKQKKKGLEKKLVGFELIDKGIARQHHKVIKTGRWWHFFADYEVTSGTKSPTLGKSIGMAYVPEDYDWKGAELAIKIRDRLVKAKVVKRPFVKNG